MRFGDMALRRRAFRGPGVLSGAERVSSAGGDFGEAWAERGAASLAIQKATGNEMSSDR